MTIYDNRKYTVGDIMYVDYNEMSDMRTIITVMMWGNSKCIKSPLTFVCYYYCCTLTSMALSV